MDELSRHRYPSNNWKQDLRVSSRHFSEHEGFGEGTTSVCVGTERYVMHAALAIRKLLDQQALTEEVRTHNWPLRSHRCIRRPEHRWFFEGTIDLENHHHFVRYYDVATPEKDCITLQNLANYLIHSFVFAVDPPAHGRPWSEARFYFNSDLNCRELVYEMTVAEFEGIVAEILYDEPVWISSKAGTGRVVQHNQRWRNQLYRSPGSAR